MLKRWVRQGSNLRPRDYESPALTTELRTRCEVSVYCLAATRPADDGVWGSVRSERPQVASAMAGASATGVPRAG